MNSDDEGNCACDQGWWSANCTQRCKCGDHMSCSATNGTCYCEENWYPEDNCTVFCNDTACSIQKSGNGYCSDSGQCVCEPDWYPPDTCNVKCNAAICAQKTNNNSTGKCTRHGECKCKPNMYPLDKCNRFCNDTACSNAHSTNAYCNYDGFCVCKASFFGASCEFKCFEGTVVNQTNCVCNANWTGVLCNCSDSISCNNNGKCDPTTGLCNCFEDNSFFKLNQFQGKDCSSKVTPWALIGIVIGGLVVLVVIVAAILISVFKHRNLRSRNTSGYQPIQIVQPESSKKLKKALQTT